MAQGNLELARRFMELARQDDWSRVEMLAEDVVYRPIAEITETGEYFGRPGYRYYMESFFQSDWAKDLTIEDTSFREYGDAVIIRIQLRGRGRASELDFGARVFEVLTFSDGKVVRVEDFLDRNDALKAAGQ